MKTTNSILRTIAYFDIFRYPVSAKEIYLFLDHPATITEVETALSRLTAEEQVFCFDEFYLLHNEPALVQRRLQGNARAAKLLPVAYRIGNTLNKFPFVRGVGISGSLSKDYADKNSDIDFFIVTGANRLWIARTLLHCLKKLSFLTGKQHWYCMNYFIDEEALVIAEKNIFTATEVITLKPVNENGELAGFFKANRWAFDQFPNHPLQTVNRARSGNDPWYKIAGEKIFANRFGNWLDSYLMQITEKRWLEKEKKHKLNSKGDPLGLVTGKHIARPNPEYFQKKILGMFEERTSVLR